jgi:hypothetical protein
VGNRLPGTFDIAYAEEGYVPSPGSAAFLLEVAGTPNVRVRAKCRVVVEGPDNFAEAIGDVPLTIDLDGAAVDCTVRKLKSSGRIDVVLYGPDGSPIASGITSASRGGVRVRSSGPWGGPLGDDLPGRFVLLKDPPDKILPSGNAVPPLGDPIPPLGNPVPPFRQSPVMPQ